MKKNSSILNQIYSLFISKIFNESPFVLNQESMSLKLSLMIGFDVVRNGLHVNVANWTQGSITQSDPSLRYCT